MPIKPENRDKYPPDWDKISLRIRTERGNKCEQCLAEYRKPNPFNGLPTILTVAHLDHDPSNCAEDNLKCLCTVCHLRYDAPHHAKNAKKTRYTRKYQHQKRLWGDE